MVEAWTVGKVVAIMGCIGMLSNMLAYRVAYRRGRADAVYAARRRVQGPKGSVRSGKGSAQAS